MSGLTESCACVLQRMRSRHHDWQIDGGLPEVMLVLLSVSAFGSWKRLGLKIVNFVLGIWGIRSTSGILNICMI